MNNIICLRNAGKYVLVFNEVFLLEKCSRLVAFLFSVFWNAEKDIFLDPCPHFYNSINTCHMH